MSKNHLSFYIMLQTSEILAINVSYKELMQIPHMSLVIQNAFARVYPSVAIISQNFVACRNELLKTRFVSSVFK
ncbi:uncharacterized protein RAG0_04148 [Rhynchosporium agropyri]|uniref:Uncharacterized protein n=1 Tax=Rhynchosporium agropyri TaxID=914238 RepID=A0A1E1K7Q7_9HELO|nr:uncharacterized protein RAG0_04148 [Rhynchosporium agropyri]